MTTPGVPPLGLLDRYVGRDFQVLYAARVTVTGGAAHHGRASGVVRSDDGALDIELRLPVAMGGPGGGTNPEQLMAAAYCACFHGALNLLALKQGIAIPDSSVEMKLVFGRDPVDGWHALQAEVTVRLPGVERMRAERLVRATERICPYAKLVRRGIEDVVRVVV